MRQLRRKTAPSRGILRTNAVETSRSRHDRYHPSPDLARYVEHYWCIDWDLRDVGPQRVEILPHPSVHLTFDRSGDARVRGLTLGKFSNLLQGKDGVIGVKFTPGGFYPFLRASVSSLTNRVVDIRDIFGNAGGALARAMSTKRADATRIALIEKFLRAREREDDDTVDRMSDLVYAVAEDRGILKVEDLAARAGTTTRTLQRLFAKYVGASPKWVIQRYRLHEAAEQLASGDVKQTDLALRLGYSDQAHFIRDFKSMVGTSPAAYAKHGSNGVEVSTPSGGRTSRAL